MRYKLSKLTAIFSSAMLLLMTYSFVKTRSGFTDLSKTSDMVILMNSGLTNFKASNVLVNTASPDTVKKTLTVELASSNSSNGPTNVTIGVDNSVIAPYNSANGTNFQPFPANAFKIVNTTVNIPGGLSHYGTATVWIFQNKLDPAVSYILPVAITDGGGKQLSSNQNVIYYNVIGNPLAGAYLQDFSRWNAPVTDTTLPPNSTVTTGVPAIVAPVTATTVLLPESYLQTFVGSTAGVSLSFTNTGGVLSNFTVFLDPTTLAGLTAGGFTVVTAPKLVGYEIKGTAANNYAGSRFRIYMALLNSTPAQRTVIDTFVKQ